MGQNVYRPGKLIPLGCDEPPLSSVHGAISNYFKPAEWLHYTISAGCPAVFSFHFGFQSLHFQAGWIGGGPKYFEAEALGKKPVVVGSTLVRFKAAWWA